jgi:GntR family transcriptional regulator
MDFTNRQAIYLQIVDYVCEQILRKKWTAEEKITSIRDLAVELQVNPNTVQRSYDFLQDLEVITNRRGLGIFLEKDAVKKVIVYKKSEFTKNELPVVFKNMQLLNMEIRELETLFNQYTKSKVKR